MCHAAETFVVDEEEGFVFSDWSAESCAKLILVVRGFLAPDGFEETDSVENRVPVEFPKFAVKLVRAAFDAGVDYRARSATVFGAVVVRLGPEFGKRIGVG